ncbi:MAG: type II toxin-antitoxin system VapC family toxin [Coriobacteriia bacterium]
MSARRVLDASVAVAVNVPEAASEACMTLIDETRERLVPDIFFAEYGNAVWKRRMRGDITAEQASIAMEWLGDLDVETVPCRDHIAEAVELAIAMGQPVYDCLYLVLASLYDAELVTLDTNLAAAARLAGVGVTVPLSGSFRAP